MIFATLSAIALLSTSQPHWVGTWASAQQIPEDRNALAPADLLDATMREIVHTSGGGTAFRVRLSNAFGTQPLTLSAHVARAASPASAQIDPATDRALTFNGATEVTIPAGAEYWSDPIEGTLPAQSDLAISLYFRAPPVQQTSHPGSRATTYVVHGNHLSDANLDAPQKVDHWFNLSGVDVMAGGEAVVTLGDSITDGHGATTNGNDRWPDILARRLVANNVSVLNTGIGGGRILQDGLGPNAAARFTRDVLAQSHVTAVIVLEGINDLGTATINAPISPADHAALVQRLEIAYSQMIDAAHGHGVKIYGGTIMPFTGSDYYHPDAANETDRQALNAWIRAPGQFDGVVDFDAVIRDPQHPDHLRPDYDSGDHLHPNPAGYRAMGEAVPVVLFEPVVTTVPQAAPKPVSHYKHRHRHR